jgi:flavin-dependent dehydrogenase
VIDVLIVGAGPAGAVAGAILARGGARVRLVDRAPFPRDKLCGDTVNPGTLARLEALGLADDIEARGLRVDGMLVTGEGDVAIAGRYPGRRVGRAIIRRDLDWLLLQRAIAAGCEFEPGVAVRRPIVDTGRPRPLVRGAVAGTAAARRELRAPITIAADGRRSTMAFGLGLARHPARPRRWAIGGYFENFAPPGVRPWGQTQGSDPESTFGEMHVRRGRYIGVALVPGGLTNVCLVRPAGPADAELADPAALLVRELARDRALRDRAAGARLAGPPVVLGPLAVDVRDQAIDGLLLAGDAAGFIDPMTGDGLRFAIRGGELAAAAALQVLEHGWTGVHSRLRAARRRDFGGKWRFNRVLRTLVSSPRGVDLAAAAARVAPAILRAVIARAGDCHAAASERRG